MTAAIRRVVLSIDRWQQHHRIPAVMYGVVKKSSDDQANLYVVNLGWYGFTAIYPLLLLIVTVFAFLGSSLGHGILRTLHQFPVIGADFTPGKGSSSLHHSALGLVVGALGLVYGAQGVTQTTYATMGQVWNVPQLKRGGFLPKLVRSVAGLVTIGGAFFINAFVGGLIGVHGQALWLRILLTAGLVVLNIALYWVSFWILTPPAATDRRFLPGAVVAAVGFTVLTTVGTGLVEHQLRHVSNTYGAFASVIALVTYLLLLAKVTVFAAELNPVLARHLWPRALPMAPPTEADQQVVSTLATEEKRWPEEHIDVSYRPDPVTADPDRPGRDDAPPTEEVQSGGDRGWPPGRAATWPGMPTAD